MDLCNVRARRYTATGACGVGRAKLVGMIVRTGVGEDSRLTITNGVGGAVLFDGDFHSNTSVTFDIPHGGVLFDQDPVVTTATNISAFTLLFL